MRCYPHSLVKIPLWIAALVLAAVTARAQVAIPPIEEIVEVRLINIDVVVTDRQGNPVPGLTREDFEVYEKGKRQEITNFSEFAATPDLSGTAPSEAPARRIVIFIDTYSTDTFERKRAAEALTGFLRDLRPADEVMVVRWNRTLSIVVPSTSDGGRLAEGLQRVIKEVSLGSGSPLWKDKPANRTEARMRARTIIAETRETAAALLAILANLAGADGKKALILLSNGFSMRPGSELLPEQEAEMLEEEQESAAEVLASITRRANAAGVVLYTLHAVGLDSGLSVEDRQPGSSMARERRNSNVTAGLGYLANRTGGLVAANTTDFRRALRNIARDLSSYYSLAYRANASRIDREKEIEVRTRDKSLIVRARRSFVERSFESEIVDQLLAGLFFTFTSNDLSISAVAGAPKRRGRNKLEVPIDVRIPLSSLAFSSTAEGYQSDLSIYIASVDAKGSTSEVKRMPHRVTLTREQLARARGKSRTFGIDLELRSPAGQNRVAVAVFDSLSKSTGFATALVTMPAK